MCVSRALEAEFRIVWHGRVGRDAECPVSTCQFVPQRAGCLSSSFGKTVTRKGTHMNRKLSLTATLLLASASTFAQNAPSGPPPAPQHVQPNPALIVEGIPP